MYRRVVRVAVVATVVAMMLFALPLAVVSQSFLLEREQMGLEVSALSAAAVVPSRPDVDRVELPPAPAGQSLTVYSRSGNRLAGSGPRQAGPQALAALHGRASRGVEDGQVVAAVPVVTGEQIVAVVEAAEPASQWWRKVALAWGVVALALVASLTVAVLVARRQSRQLARPLKALTRAATDVAEGDLLARAQRSGIAELDSLAIAHNSMLDRLVDTIEREGRFSADAAHQLRTPLARLRLRLEGAREAGDADRDGHLSASLADLESLQVTVDDLLALARVRSSASASSPSIPLGTLLDAMTQRWREPLAERGRRLDISTSPEVGVDVRVPGQRATSSRCCWTTPSRMVAARCDSSHVAGSAP